MKVHDGCHPILIKRSSHACVEPPHPGGRPCPLTCLVPSVRYGFVSTTGTRMWRYTGPDSEKSTAFSSEAWAALTATPDTRNDDEKEHCKQKAAVKCNIRPWKQSMEMQMEHMPNQLEMHIQETHLQTWICKNDTGRNQRVQLLPTCWWVCVNLACSHK